MISLSSSVLGPSFPNIYDKYVGKTTAQIVHEYRERKENPFPDIFEVSKLQKALEVLQKATEAQQKASKAQKKATRGSYLPKSNHVKKQVESSNSMRISDLFLVMINVRDVKKS